MTDQIIHEWMSEWKNLDGDRLSAFGDSVLSNEDLFQAITHVLDENDRFRPLYDGVISTLFAFYRSSERKLKLFAAQFIPSLVYVYLHQLHSQKNCVLLETLIRGIYELESASEDRPPVTARIPDVYVSSVYHDPLGIAMTWSPDTNMDRSNRSLKVLNRPNLTFTEERVRAPQRLPLCTEVWWYFNHRLSELPKHAVPVYLKTISKLVTQGFHLGGPQRGQPPVRIVLSSKLLIEIVSTIYFTVYNGAPTLAEQTLEEVSYRAHYQLWGDAIIVCNAVKNYLKSSGKNPNYPVVQTALRIEDVLALGQNQFCVWGETVADVLNRAQKTATDRKLRVTMEGILKNMKAEPVPSSPYKAGALLPLQVEVSNFKKTIITNASFRTKKLPDDIPIVEKETIPEEGGSGDGATSTTISKSLSKLPHILSKIKRNSVVVINEEGDVETMAMSTPPERKKSVDHSATPV